MVVKNNATNLPWTFLGGKAMQKKQNYNISLPQNELYKYIVKKT